MTGPYDLYDRLAIVTGAASGIGLATAHVLVRRGARVAVLDRSVSGAEDAVRALGGNAHARAFPVDLADSDSIASAVAAAHDVWGAADILVASAGITGGSYGVLDVPEDLVELAHRVNVHGNFVLARLVLTRMLAERASGRVVFLSSSSAFRAEASAAHYSTTKAAIAQLTRSLAAEVGPHGITVNAVAPGPTDTPLSPWHGEDLDQQVQSGPLKNLMGRAARADEVAEVVAFLCSPAAAVITGQVIHTSLGAIV